MLRNCPDGHEVRLYLNDASLQGQFTDRVEFECMLRSLMEVRSRIPAIRQNLRVTRSLQEALVYPGTKFRNALFQLHDKELKTVILSWLDRSGPFVDDDRLDEIDDYFEYRNVEVTATGLGEAARRTKAGIECATYSFFGGDVDYAVDPLEINHGLREERYGQYLVSNVWKSGALVERARATYAPSGTWSALIEVARQHFPNLEIGPLDANPALAREPFDAALRDRSMRLMKILNDYAAGRNDDGTDGPGAHEIRRNYFTGDRALFSGESSTIPRSRDNPELRWVDDTKIVG